jgi:hypothetical protein
MTTIIQAKTNSGVTINIETTFSAHGFVESFALLDNEKVPCRLGCGSFSRNVPVVTFKESNIKKVLDYVGVKGNAQLAILKSNNIVSIPTIENWQKMRDEIVNKTKDDKRKERQGLLIEKHQAAFDKARETGESVEIGSGVDITETRNGENYSYWTMFAMPDGTVKRSDNNIEMN